MPAKRLAEKSISKMTCSVSSRSLNLISVNRSSGSVLFAVRTVDGDSSGDARQH